MFTASERLHHMGNWIARVSRKSLVKDSAIILLANAGVSAALLVCSVVLARLWGPSAFGALNTLFAIISFSVGITDLGITISLVKLVSKYRLNDPARYKFLLLACLIAELSIGLLLALVGVIGATYFSKLLFQTDQYAFLVAIAFVTSALLSSAAFVTAILQGHERFVLLAQWTLIPVVVRAICLISFTLWWRSLAGVMYGYLAATVGTCAVGMFMVCRSYLSREAFQYQQKKAVALEFFGFTKWIAGSIFLGTLALRLDALLLASRSNATEVGIYVVAAQLAMVAPLVITTLNTTLIPRVSRLKTRQDYVAYFRESLGVSCAAGIGFVLLAGLSSPLIGFMYGPAYAPAVAVLRLLALAYAFTALVWPLFLLIYALGRPDIQTKVNVLQVAVQIMGNFLLIPRLGAQAPAIMFFAVSVGGLLLMLLWILWLYVKGEGRIEELPVESRI
jgi:O-antigen/teichoic acid export membrane protein